MQISHPEIFLNENDRVELRKRHSELVEVNAFERQIKELYLIQNPQYVGVSKTEIFASESFKSYRLAHQHTFVHIYFPWLNTLVKTVDADEYFLLKTNRNQDLITATEQAILRSYTVAVLGMSVGSNIAFALTQSGISNHIVLADFDELDTTNLNRIPAGVHEVGLNKTLVAAHHIYEDNPFATVTTLTEGVDEEKLEALLKEGTIRCIIEEVDDMQFKVRARQLAMRYKIPVLMVTDNGDGVVLHVERYDLGHTAIWGKPIAHYEKLLASGPLSRQQAGDIIMNDIVGGVHRVDSRMIASVQRVLAHELVSWSQLGSAALLGAVVASVAIKKIVLNEAGEKDIRMWVAPEHIERGSHTT